MNQRSQLFLAKGSRALEAAELLLARGHAESTAGRAYFAMLHAAHAFLADAGTVPRTHRAVRSTFGLRLRSTTMEPRMHRWLIDAADLRRKADYDPEGVVSMSAAATAVANAREMLAVIADHLTSPPP